MAPRSPAFLIPAPLLGRRIWNVILLRYYTLLNLHRNDLFDEPFLLILPLWAFPLKFNQIFGDLFEVTAKVQSLLLSIVHQRLFPPVQTRILFNEPPSLCGWKELQSPVLNYTQLGTDYFLSLFFFRVETIKTQVVPWDPLMLNKWDQLIYLVKPAMRFCRINDILFFPLHRT